MPVVLVLIGFIFLMMLNQGKMKNGKDLQLSKDFWLSEFLKTSTGKANVPGASEIEKMKALCLNVLQPLRDYLNKPVIITSGFRSAAVNAAIGGSSKTSQHMKGEAADFVVNGMTNEEIINVIHKLKLPYDQIINEKLKGKQWVHVSYVPGGRYEHLLAIDGPNGTTKYVYA